MRRRSFALLTLGAVAGVVTCEAPGVRANTTLALAIVVAPNSKMTDISLPDLRRVFTGERITDPAGNKLIPLNHPPKTADRVGFDKAALGMDAENVARFWIDRRIRGLPGPPRTVDSLGTLRRVVEKLPGAIAYLRPGQSTAEVKVIRVDGKLPDDPKYPLRFEP